MEEVEGWADPPEPPACLPSEESADASASTFCALGGSLVEGSDVGEWGALDLHDPCAASSPRAQRSSSFASAAGQSAGSASLRLPQSRGGLADPTRTPEPRSPVVPSVGRFFLLFVWAGLAYILYIE